MSSKTYDNLKILVIVINAGIACWIAIGEIWGFPYVEQIAGTASAIAGFIGALLKISSDRYNGAIELEEAEVDDSHWVNLGDMDEDAK